MKVFMYSIFDRASGVYDRPFPSNSDQEATRGFTDLCMNDETMIGRHPDDFTLFRIGTWENNKGELFPSGAPEKVINGAEAVASRKNVVPLKENVDG